MEARRTLTSEGPLGNALPPNHAAPPSAMKKNSRMGGARASMLPRPNANRQSMIPAPSAPTLTHSSSQEQLRRSTMASNGLMSANRGDGGIYGRTPQSGRMMTGGIRRSSTFAGGRQSMAPGAYPAALQRDTRPIRDRSFQAACQTNISAYLASHHCPLPMHSRLLTSPTTKEFHQVFRFLVQDYTDSTSWTKQFENDAIAILKDLRYPAMDGIGKTAFTAPGSPNHWPALVAMLNWLVELNKAHENWSDLVADPLLKPAAELPTDHPLLEDRAFWDYAKKTYEMWYQNDTDEFPEADLELEQIYDRLAQATFEESEELETTVQKREAELQQLQATEPPLKRVEDEYVQLMSDKTKFIAFIDMHKQKAEKLRSGNEFGHASIKEHEEQLANLRIELQRTEEAVAAQNLSPDEVVRMNHERETLTRQLEELRIKIAEASQQAYDQELQVTKSMDRFESLHSDYVALAHQIGTIPPLLDGPGPALGPDGVDYTIDVDLGVEDINEVVAAGKKLRGVIWPALQVLSERFRVQLMEEDNLKISLEDELDKKVQEVDGMKDEAGNRQARLTVMLDKAEDAKNALQDQNAGFNAQIARVEQEVASMAEESQHGVVQQESYLEAKRIQFEELRHKTAQLQDAMTAEIGRHIDIIIKAKEHTANSLKGLRAFAEAQ